MKLNKVLPWGTGDRCTGWPDQLWRGVYAGPDTTCPFAQNVEANYTGLGADYAYSPVTGENYTMNCVAGYGNLNGGDSVVCTGGDNALVEWGAN
jgi:hypothetical protein